MIRAWIATLAAFASIGSAAGQAVRFAPSGDGTRPRLTVAGTPWLVLGMQVFNSSGTPDELRSLAGAVRRSGANTLIVPVSWEAVEAEPGRFDFTGVDGLIAEARRQGVRLVLSWFGTWKNGNMSYAPSWIKRDTAAYPRVIDRDGHALDVLSPLGTKSLAADARAFTAFMAHLRTVDARTGTVIMVQVENEAGTLGSDRDYSPAADRLYAAAVPEEMRKPLGASAGTWSTAFGARAPEAFMAYHTARYIGRVAAAGKAAYDLPLYVNVWPREQPGLLRPGLSSPSGGATSSLLPAWKALAPAIDVVGGDNYDTNVVPYTAILRAYDRPDNVLFTPETGGAAAHARHMFIALATPYSIGIAKFGFSADYASASAASEPVAVNYRLLREAVPFLLPLRDAGHVRAAVEEEGIANVALSFGRYDAVARFGEVRDGYGGARGQGNAAVDGRVLIAEIAPDRFLVTGAHANLLFAPKLGAAGAAQLVSVEQGHFEAGRWVCERLLNGDETAFGLVLPAGGGSLEVTVMTR